jgi:hypothetical protein
VPLEIKIAYSGQVSITVDEMKDVTNSEIFITDKLTGTSYPIINNKANINIETGTYTDRFVLTFRESNVLSTIDNTLGNETTIYTDNKNELLIIKKQQELIINNVDIYSMIGNKVSSWSINEQQQTLELDLNNKIPTGVYIVRLNTNKGDISEKIIIE